MTIKLKYPLQQWLMHYKSFLNSIVVSTFLSLTLISSSAAISSIPIASTLVFEVKSSQVSTDLGATVVNQLFATSNVFYRICPSCVSTHQLIFYQRVSTMPASFSIYSSMISLWSASNNILNTDFKLFGSYADFSTQQNAWQVCNYDGVVAFPRDCGPTSVVVSQWNSLVSYSSYTQNYAFYVINPPASGFASTSNIFSITEAKFAYTGSAQYVTVPANTYSTHVNVMGAAGGSDYYSTSAPYFPGGLGGVVSTDISISSGNTLCIYVGSKGSSRTGTTPGVCNGGYNGGGSSGKYLGAGGGGASDIRTACNSYASVLVVAGGGGGGKSPSQCYSDASFGASPGGAILPLCNSATVAPGQGSTAAGGRGGSCGFGSSSAGTYQNGGAGNSFGYGAGGGGGYFGGGGGCDTMGGGGSSYCSSTVCKSPQYSTASSISDGSVSISFKVLLPVLDLNWKLTSVPAGVSFTAGSNAYIVSITSTCWAEVNSVNSKWIGLSSSCSTYVAQGSYTYQVSFPSTAFQCSSMSVQFAADDYVTSVKVINENSNIVYTKFDGPNNWFSLSNLTITGFGPTSTTIMFTVYNINNGPSGLLVKFSAPKAIPGCAIPTLSPSMEPNPQPSAIPTSPPTVVPTVSPTFVPSVTPTSPTLFPTSPPSSSSTFLQDTAIFTSKYFSFSGDNSYLFSSMERTLNSTFSISVWISTSSRHPASIVSLGRSPSRSTGGEFVLQINKDGNLYFSDYSSTSGAGFSVVGGKVINYAGLRIHVAVVRNGHDCTIYINGRASGHSISTVSVVYENAYLVFGMDYRNKSSYFEGTMDHIAIYSQPLSESSINSLYNSEVGAPTPAPTPLSAQTISNSNDSGGSANKGGCDVNCIISITSIVGTFLGICAAYHIYWMQKRKTTSGNQQGSTSTSYRTISHRSNPVAI